ncbi:MAG: beta-galactosidase, partial [Clostridia bacterium]|nr:beta-galactosidase [Clostridia bacterium]
MRRTAYPRPELRRSQWTNLCGKWEFEFDYGKSAKESGALFGKYSHRIDVPFCPESKLSGLEHKDFIPACMYRRKFNVIKADGMRTVLNFEAVYFRAEVYVNEKPVGSHDGGYTPFSFDITDAVNDGENVLVVWCCGDPRNGREPSGKQCLNYYSKNCNYTRSTGIYQPVWLETVPEKHLKSVKLDTYEDGSVYARLSLTGDGDAEVTLTASLDGKKAASFKGTATTGDYTAVLNVKEPRLWSPASPTLYDLKIEIRKGDYVDRVQSYFGIRTVSLDKYGMRINGKRVFQRLVLDQGYYHESVYTAPDDGAFAEDIRLSMRMGFNGARLHERVFERRFLYEADRMGYLVWGEYPNWGLDHSYAESVYGMLPEWLEEVERDFNHPSIIGWCPF